MQALLGQSSVAQLCPRKQGGPFMLQDTEEASGPLASFSTPWSLRRVSRPLQEQGKREDVDLRL
jgi:hypothetical protein